MTRVPAVRVARPCRAWRADRHHSARQAGRTTGARRVRMTGKARTLPWRAFVPCGPSSQRGGSTFRMRKSGHCVTKDDDNRARSDDGRLGAGRICDTCRGATGVQRCRRNRSAGPGRGRPRGILPSQRAAYVRDLLILSIEVDLETSAGVWRETTSVAERHRLTLYDAAYLELGLRRGLPLATFDAALRRAASAAGLHLLLRLEMPSDLFAVGATPAAAQAVARQAGLRLLRGRRAPRLPCRAKRARSGRAGRYTRRRRSAVSLRSHAGKPPRAAPV